MSDWKAASLEWARKAQQEFQGEKSLRREVERGERDEAREGLRLTKMFILAQSLGNLYRSLARHEESKKWYDETLDILSARGQRPSVASAFTLWKAGRWADCVLECEALLERARGAAPESGEVPFRVQRDRTLGLLLSGRYAEAADAARRIRLLKGYESGSFSLVEQMADSLVAHDVGAWKEAVRELSKRVGRWPSFESDDELDLFRWALQKSVEAFGELPTGLEGAQR